MRSNPATPATHATIQPLCTDTRAPADSVHTFGVSHASLASQQRHPRCDAPTYGHPRIGPITEAELNAARADIAGHADSPVP
jgi:hypothetical protein